MGIKKVKYKTATSDHYNTLAISLPPSQHVHHCMDCYFLFWFYLCSVNFERRLVHPCCRGLSLASCCSIINFYIHKLLLSILLVDMHSFFFLICLEELQNTVQTQSAICLLTPYFSCCFAVDRAPQGIRIHRRDGVQILRRARHTPTARSFDFVRSQNINWAVIVPTRKKLLQIVISCKLQQ